MESKHFALIVSIGVLLFVLELIRRQKMTFRYSLFWLSACVCVLLGGIFDPIVRQMAHLAGFKVTSNFIFFLLFVFFTALSLLLTLYINEQNDRTQALAQTIGALENKLRNLEEKSKKTG